MKCTIEITLNHHNGFDNYDDSMRAILTEIGKKFDSDLIQCYGKMKILDSIGNTIGYIQVITE